MACSGWLLDRCSESRSPTTSRAWHKNAVRETCNITFPYGGRFGFNNAAASGKISKVVEAIENQDPHIFGPYGAYSQAYGLMNTACAAGGLVGPLYAGFVRVWLGWGAMSLSMGLSGLIMLVFVVSLTGESIFHNSRASAG